MDLGISTFVELTPDPLTGKTISAYQRLHLMAEVSLADQLGFAIGEHHSPEYLVQFSVGTLPHHKMMHAIELFGNAVAPAARKALNPSVIPN